MGISGLLPLLKSIQKTTHIREWAGKTVGVDAYSWLHKGTIPCAIELALGTPSSKYVDYAMHRVRMLRHFGVTPYLVFDGDYLPSKAATEIERERKREQSRKAGLEMYNLGRRTQAYTEFQKAIDVTPIMARHLIDACKADGVQCIVAPYEADAQMYYLEKMGIIDAIVTEDSDLLVFGAKCVLTKLGQFGDCQAINRADLGNCREVSLAGWSDAEFRHMCILSGCDYLENIPNMGLKTAHRLLKRHRQIDKVLRAVRFEGKLKVPEGYKEAFERADLTFQHQRVFCPIKNCLVMCNEPDEPLADETLVYIGAETELDLARGVACGDLDPVTKAPIVVAPPAASKHSPWAQPRRPAQPVQGKTITDFFKARQNPHTPLRARSPNIPLPASAPVNAKPAPPSAKRPAPWSESMPKRPRLDPEVSQNVVVTGERSAFFHTQSRRESQRRLLPPPPAPRFEAKTAPPATPETKASVFETPDVVPESTPTTLETPCRAKVSLPDTPEATTATKKPVDLAETPKDAPPLAQSAPPTAAAEAPPTPASKPTISTANAPSHANSDADADAIHRVTEGWRNTYTSYTSSSSSSTNSSTALNTKLSVIIEKHKYTPRASTTITTTTKIPIKTPAITTTTTMKGWLQRRSTTTTTTTSGPSTRMLGAPRTGFRTPLTAFKAPKFTTAVAAQIPHTIRRTLSSPCTSQESVDSQGDRDSGDREGEAGDSQGTATETDDSQSQGAGLFARFSYTPKSKARTTAGR